MSEFYLFSLITSITFLVLWQTLGRARFLRRFFGTLFLMSIIAYAFSLFDLHLKDFYSMKVLFRDLVILTFASFVSVIARRSILISASWLLIAGFTIFTLFQNRTVLLPRDFELDPDSELLVKLSSPSAFEGSDFAQYLAAEGIAFSQAFNPEDAGNTELDDYLELDLPIDNVIELNSFKKRISEFSMVEYIEENEVIQLSPIESAPAPVQENLNFNDPLAGQQWALSALNVDELRAVLSSFTPKKKARLFILDTGIDANHEDLQSNYLSHKKKYDSDVQSHGTHCAGIAGAVSNNGIGIASMVMDQNLFHISAIKVLNDYGMGNQKTIINGILEASDNGADVISLSLGGRSTDKRQRAYEEAVAYANKKGSIVVVAAGNSSMNAKGYSPANTNGVIAVAAIDQNKKLATFSNTIEDLRMGLAAPGVGIMSTVPGNEYKAYNGTSMATPYVAGLVALMKCIDPNITTEMAYELMNSNGEFISNSSKSGNLIDPAKTIKSLIGQ